MLRMLVACLLCFFVTNQSWAEDLRVTYANGPFLPPEDISSDLLIGGGGCLADLASAEPADAIALLTQGGWQALALTSRDLEAGFLPEAAGLPPLLASNLRRSEHRPSTIASALVIEGTLIMNLLDPAFDPIDDWQIIDSEQAVDAALSAHPDETRVILIAESPRADLRELVATRPRIDLVLANDGIFDDTAILAGHTPMLTAPAATGSLSYSQLQRDDARAWHSIAHRLVAARQDLPDDLQERYARCRLGGVNLLRTARQADVPGPEALVDIAPETIRERTLDTDHRFAFGVSEILRLSAANEAAAVVVHSLTARKSYGGHLPPDGHEALLALDTEWLNIMPVEELAPAAARLIYQAKNLADHCYLIADGKRLLPLLSDAHGLPGHLDTKPFALNGRGAVERGNLVFPLPSTEVHHLELRLYEEAYGSLRIPLVGEETPEHEALTEPQRNAVMELAAYDVAVTDRYRDATPAAGHRFVVVDLRGRSLITLPLTHWMPDADPEARVRSFADWTQWRRHCSLLTENGAVIAPHDALTFPDTIRFPPDPITGHRIAFMVPADAGALRLRCDFPKAELPDGSIIEPGALTFALPLGDQRAGLLAARDEVEQTVDGVAAANEQTAPGTDNDSNDGEPQETLAERFARLTGADRQPRGLAGVGLEARAVNDAIDRGRAFLWGVLSEELPKVRGHRYEGEHILAALALVHAEAHREWPECDAAIRELISNYRTGRVYRQGLFAMLVHAYGDPSLRDQLRNVGAALLGGQGGNGSWAYRGSDWPEQAAVQRDALTIIGGQSLEERAERQVLQATRPWDPEHRGGDNSITQFAALGLRAAENAGLEVADPYWQRIEQLYRERQHEELGGWGYHSSGAYGSMTCAGICSLAVANYHQDKPDPLLDADLIDGLSYLAENYHPSVNFSKKRFNYYYIYSLERVGRILDTDFFGEHEWYPLSARFLIGAQQADGSWIGSDRHEEDPRIATSFALLFLTRATEGLEPEPIERGGPGTLEMSYRAPRQRSLYFILDASGSMLLEDDDDVSRFDRAREALRDVVAQLPADLPVGLRAYGHRKRAIEEGADEDTELVLPIAPLDRQALADALAELRARGKTPLGLSLQQARRDLRDADNGALVVLLTDGGDDARSVDPVAAARQLAKSDNTELAIVGLTIDRPQWQEQLQAMATAADGRLFHVAEASSLASSLQQVLLGRPDRYRLFNANGDLIAAGAFGEKHELTDGRYTLEVTWLDQVLRRELWINTNRTTRAVFSAADLDTQNRTTPAPTPAAEPDPPADGPTPANQNDRASIPANAAFCTFDGTALDADARFCPGCGRPIAADEDSE